MVTREEVERLRAELRQKEEILLLQKEKEKQLTPAKRIAKMLHDRMCPENGSDGCDTWQQEDGWIALEHLEYLNIAYRLIKVLGTEEFAKRAIKAIFGH